MSTRTQKRKSGLVVIWEFYVDGSKRRAFERAYGPQGVWAKLFRSANGYIRTDLVRDLDTPTRYLTLDHWISSREYERFRKKNVEAYIAIDQKCEALTTKETKIGEFTIQW